MAGLKDYLNKRKQLKLYRQWVDSSGLPPDEIPDDLKKQPAGGEYDEQDMTASGIFPPSRVKTITVSLRLLFFLIIMIAVLLIALSVMTTLYVVKT